MKKFIIFAVLLTCFVFSTKYINAGGFEDLLPLRSKSIALNEAGFNFIIMETYKNLDLQDLPNEIWKDIKWYEGKYQASNLGRIKSLTRLVKKKYNTQGILKGRILKQPLTFSYKKPNAKHLRIRLYKGLGQKSFATARVIGITFIPNPENKPQINHKDGNRLNNHLLNLEWMTGSENVQHAYDTGLRKDLPRGENNRIAKLTNKKVFEIRKDYKPGYGNQTKLAQKYSVTQSVIWHVINRKSWKHI